MLDSVPDLKIDKERVAMKFTLLFYTDGWTTGPVIELSHVPSPGNVVWTAGKRRGEDGDMYYVDNVMYPERGMDGEETVYLYVRPYKGYGEYAPLTEADRIVERLGEIKGLIDSLASIVRRMEEAHASLAGSLGVMIRETEDFTTGLRERGGTLSAAAEQLIQLADAIEDGQQTQLVKMDDIALLIEELKERL